LYRVADLVLVSGFALGVVEYILQPLYPVTRGGVLMLRGSERRDWVVDEER
jgi:hypothetical protein